jgi:sodium/potassium-transporting ATPase subunit alpha
MEQYSISQAFQKLKTDAHKIPLEEFYATLRSNDNGLTSSESSSRLLNFGSNELNTIQKTPEYLKFLRQFANFFAFLLMTGGCLALLADYLDPDKGNFYIACALFGVVVLNAVFTYLQEHQSEKIMESFRDILPQMVTVSRDGESRKIHASELVPGDLMLIEEGDRISADARLIEQNALKIDLSSLTGESEPELRHLEATHENIIESRNMVFSGTLVQSGNGKAVVYATGLNTQIGNIVQLTQDTEESETPIRKELKHFIKVISSIAIFLGVTFFLLSLILDKGAIGSLIFAIGIIVANVPEGLLPTVTLALTMASKRMARKNALIKNLESVETLGSTTVICTDKTGTLTQNRISVNTLFISGREFAAWDQELLEEKGIREASRVMTLCNNARSDSKGVYGDPTEIALLNFTEQIRSHNAEEPAGRLNEYPFDSATKHMVTVNQSQDDKMQAFLKGAPEIVLEMCSQYRLHGKTIPLDDVHRKIVLRAYRRLAKRGERVLALAMKNVSEKTIKQEEFEFIGLVGMLDPPRPEVFDAIKKCQRAGIKLIMITGDYGLTAESIGRQIGLLHADGKVIRGDELAAMNDDELSDLLASESELIFARTSPAQKLQIVKALQKNNEVVTVTGDGVNDAPALKNADLGVAMGISGTDVAKEASNMVLMDDNFATIVHAIEEGRTIFDNIKKFIAYILTSNIPEILPFIAFVILDIPLPLTVVLILAIDLGTDILPALGLGAERSETDVMQKPPRPRSERLLTRNMLAMSYGIVGMIQAMAGFFSFFVVLYAGGWSWGQQLASGDELYRTAVTAFFASIIICQIADVIICRTRRQSLLTVGFFSNRLVLIGIASELILLGLISYVPAFNIFFGTAPLEWWQLSLSIPFAIVILIGDELRRVMVRRDNAFVLKWLTW